MPDSFKITSWKHNLTKAGCSIGDIRTIADITKKNGDPLFSLLNAEVTSPEGYKLPHIVFIRGNAVIVVPLIKNSESGEERFLMIRQRRIGTGLFCLEFPAGMIDHENDDPADVAAREVCEETGLHITRDILTQLCDTPLYSSPGASDEAIYYFGCKVTVDDQTYQSLKNATGGNHEENEYCHVELLRYEEAEPRLTSLQARLAIRLFNEHFCI